tara:strand:- start:3756 stop:4370 length:615 start_codon:yes stop_codon:yes gene_type:complete
MKVIAYRGYSGLYGENTLNSFQKAAACFNFTDISMDIQCDAYGDIVVHKELIIDNGWRYIHFEDILKQLQITNEKKIILSLKGSNKIVKNLENFFRLHSGLHFSRFIIISLDIEHLKSFKIPFVLGFMTYNNIESEQIKNIKKINKRIKYYFVWWEVINQHIIDACHKEELEVIAFTINSHEEFVYIRKYTIDGIMSGFELKNL